MDLSIVIPIYNAENIIEGSVERLIKALESLDLCYEILLKNDGSHDNSSKVLESIDRCYEPVHCSSNDSNEGLGATLQRLFSEAQGKTVVYCDSDLPFGEQVISLLLNEIKDNDIVVASRYSGLRNFVSFDRKLASRLYYYLCKFLFNISVHDIGSGSLAIRQKALKKLDLKSKGFGVHVELFIKAAQNNLLVKEIPAEHFRAQRGSFYIWKHSFPTVFETMALWQRKL